MRHELSISFDGLEELDIPVSEGTLPTPEAARRWLDDEFVRLDCSPLRPSGKVLMADKVLAVASTAGQTGFDDPEWRRAFAQAACSALGRPTVKVDVNSMTVTY